MTKLPQLRPKDVARGLEKAGFLIKRKNGSHIYFHHPNCLTTSVSIHPQPLPKGTLRAILKQTRISMDELKKLLK